MGPGGGGVVRGKGNWVVQMVGKGGLDINSAKLGGGDRAVGNVGLSRTEGAR